MYQEWFDKIITYFNDRHPEELARARKEFFQRTGEIFDDDSFYEQRVACYLEWFLFDRPFGERPSAIEAYADECADEATEDDRKTLEAFRNPLHSLFEVRKITPRKDTVLLLDLVDRLKYGVTERRSLAGIDKGTVFEAHLLVKGDKIHFLQGMVVHPSQVGGFLSKQIKKMIKNGETEFDSYFMELQRCWMQCQRYSHVDPKRIYAREDF